MKDQKEIELDITIDENALDKEWTFQPRLYFRYAAKLADAKRDADQAKTEVELTKAELELAIRTNPEKFDLQKVTESAVASGLRARGGHGGVRQADRAPRHTVDILQAAVAALDHRKRALE